MKKSSTGVFDSIFGDSLDYLEIPKWVKESISRKIWRDKKLTLVSAVCPDYERQNGHFTYRSMGCGLPFTASRHLLIVQAIAKSLAAHDIQFEYHVTLADTEFDLPLVVKHFAQDNVELFFSRCEQSVIAIADEAYRLDIPLHSCARFTTAFSNWCTLYEQGLEIMRREVEQDRSTRSDLEAKAMTRMPLYQAMAGYSVNNANYCREMVIRQWAQYMAWGYCAEETFGNSVVMMNHTTPNLSKVNHPLFRKGRERIPILQLPITTMPE